MTYVKTTWTNDLTELNADNMNHIEDGIKDNETLIGTLSTTIDTNDDAVMQVIGTDTNTWSSSSTYSINDVVVYDKKLYKNLTGSNSSTTPDDDTTNWQEISIIENSELNSVLNDTSFIKTTQTTSSTDTYSCTYINNLVSSLPASDIEESGTDYIRFSDGTQICYGEKTSANNISFPKAFLTNTTPIVSASYTKSSLLCYYVNIANITNTQFDASITEIYTINYTISGTTYNTLYYRAITDTFNYIAIGVWK